MTRSPLPCRTSIIRDSSMTYAYGESCMCDMTHSYMWHDLSSATASSFSSSQRRRRDAHVFSFSIVPCPASFFFPTPSSFDHLLLYFLLFLRRRNTRDLCMKWREIIRSNANTSWVSKCWCMPRLNFYQELLVEKCDLHAHTQMEQQQWYSEHRFILEFSTPLRAGFQEFWMTIWPGLLKKGSR